MAESTKVSFIVDASYVLAFLLPDEQTEEAEATFLAFGEGNITLSSPDLLPYEVVNTLAAAVVRKRITKQQAQMLLEQFELLERTGGILQVYNK